MLIGSGTTLSCRINEDRSPSLGFGVIHPVESLSFSFPFDLIEYSVLRRHVLKKRCPNTIFKCSGPTCDFLASW